MTFAFAGSSIQKSWYSTGMTRDLQRHSRSFFFAKDIACFALYFLCNLMVSLLQLERVRVKISAAQFVYFPLHFNSSTSVRKCIQIISSSNDSFVSVFEKKVINSWAWSICSHKVCLRSFSFRTFGTCNRAALKNSFRLLLPLSEQDPL